LVYGGTRLADSKGYFVTPTIFADVTDDMTIAKEEIFGPVMSVLRYASIEDVIKRANNSPFGLAASVITNDINKALPIANRLETGTVWINTHGVFDAPAPYGGFKQSGVGREYGLEGLLPYLELKTVMIALPTDSLDVSTA
jgi:aldehyde dehydrogenase (NAD+)